MADGAGPYAPQRDGPVGYASFGDITDLRYNRYADEWVAVVRINFLARADAKL